jgi:hypothetical protein
MGFQIRRNVRGSCSSGDSTNSSIQNELKTIKLRGRKIRKERVAIIKSRMNERDSSSNSSVVIETAPSSRLIYDSDSNMIRHVRVTIRWARATKRCHQHDDVVR